MFCFRRNFLAVQQYCLSKQCITVASNILNAMDSTTHPCDDFYQYACGGWIKTNPIPEGKSVWNTFVKLSQQNQLVMKNALGDYWLFSIFRHVFKISSLMDIFLFIRARICWIKSLTCIALFIERNITEDANSAERKAQIYYNSCLDRNGTMEKLGAEPIKNLISKVGDGVH